MGPAMSVSGVRKSLGDVAEERGLRAIELGARIWLALVLRSAGDRQSRCDVGPDHPQEVAVRLIGLLGVGRRRAHQPRRGRLPARRTRH